MKRLVWEILMIRNLGAAKQANPKLKGVREVRRRQRVCEIRILDGQKSPGVESEENERLGWSSINYTSAWFK